MKRVNVTKLVPGMIIYDRDDKTSPKFRVKSIDLGEEKVVSLKSLDSNKSNYAVSGDGLIRFGTCVDLDWFCTEKTYKKYVKG